MDKVALQAKLDLQKWYDSQTMNRDMCGAYAFCVYCDKSVPLPCATAFEKLGAPPMPIRKPKKPVEKQDAKKQSSSLGKKFNYDKVMAKKAARKSLTFAEKYALSDSILKERYLRLQEELTSSLPKQAQIKSRISKQCDTYRCDGEIVAKITIIGTSLRINLPLDPNAPEYNDGKTPHVDTSNKKVYEAVPFQFKVNSRLALKRALDLINKVKQTVNETYQKKRGQAE